MVSKAREDLPDPETPVTTVRVLCGTSTSMFLRLWTRAPRTMMLSMDMVGPSPATQMRLGWSVNLSIINRNRRSALPDSVLYDRSKRFGIKAGATDEGAVNLFLGHQSFGILGLHAAAINDAHLFGHIGAESVGRLFADVEMRVHSHLWSGGLSRADRPDRFVGDDDGAGASPADLTK